MPVTYDMHIHSAYSTDSRTPLSEQILEAKKRGLLGICLTDHMDYDFPADDKEYPENPPFVFDEAEYKREIGKYRENIPALWLGAGVECGLQPYASVTEKTAALIKQGGWDFIIGSIHLGDGRDPYYPEFWEGEVPALCVRRYFETMLCCLSLFSDFDSLGHMDYIVRYAPDSFCYRPSDYQDITDEILKLLIKKDIALEVNSSGLFSAKGCENPHPSLLKRYVELGGELITLGSDAHTPERIASGFTVIERHIKEAGLHQYVTYCKRRPLFHDL